MFKIKLKSLIEKHTEQATSEDLVTQNHLNEDHQQRMFVSDKINNKLVQQLQEPLVLASRSLPSWCKRLLTAYKFLFPFETRQLYFNTTAFGVSRSIVWLQNRRDALLAALRGQQAQRGNSAAQQAQRANDHDHGEFRIGRLKHERVKIPREPREALLRAAMNALRFHATRKAILEIEFLDEEGTGLGPTLEFFSLVSAEVQRKRHGMWYCTDSPDTVENEDELFVHEQHGLFPAHYPTSALSEQHIELFNFLGVFVAKSLQDQRLVDIPLALPLLKVMCAQRGEGGENSARVEVESVLTLDDLEQVDRTRVSFLKQLRRIVESRESREEEVFVEMNGHKVNLDDLGYKYYN